MWLFVLFVSAHDGYLVITSRSTLSAGELNPIAQWLLLANRGDIWLLLAAKAVGTIIASTALLLIYWARARMGWSICAAIVLFQLTLLLFLHLA